MARAPRRTLPPDDPAHGTYNGYSNYRCKCPRCGRARALWRAKRRLVGLPAGDPRHGTPNGYDYHGCKCEDCLQANRDASAARRARAERARAGDG